jgi:hypothetical protein
LLLDVQIGVDDPLARIQEAHAAKEEAATLLKSSGSMTAKKAAHDGFADV